jgi:AcrR family transcriptional regulator
MSVSVLPDGSSGQVAAAGRPGTALSFTRQCVAVKSIRSINVTVYDLGMPRIWSETIAAHRDAVRDATLDATAALVDSRGLTGLTMSEIARQSGIGRATLYKYFPDVESILVAWHERQVTEHLRQLAAVSEATTPADRLEAVLRVYVAQSAGGRRQHSGDLAAMLHHGEHATRAHAHLNAFITALISEAAARGEARDDVPAAELAAYCLHALTACAAMPSEAAVDRLIEVTLVGLRRAR